MDLTTLFIVIVALAFIVANIGGDFLIFFSYVAVACFALTFALPTMFAGFGIAGLWISIGILVLLVVRAIYQIYAMITGRDINGE